MGGGCLLPSVLFLIAAAQGDTGGPLFWPVLALGLGFLGLILGTIVDIILSLKR